MSESISGASLKVLQGPLAGQSFLLGESFVIGRAASCDLTLPDETVSRNHTRIERKGEVRVIRDLGSRNGTLVNGRKVSVQMLTSGDRIEIGHALLLYSSNSDSSVETVMVPSSPGAPAGARLAVFDGAKEEDRPASSPAIIGRSPAIRRVLDMVEEVASSDASVLITGETGTGKELVARALHTRSGRPPERFIAVNCAAIPETLLESELFGHEKGAFTGADHRRKGKFEEADGGTLLLDEIGDMPLSLQSKLLRVVEEKRVERLGGKAFSVDTRLVCATNRDLPKAVAEGTFRADLYYRLNVVHIPLPSLRERLEDLPLLVEHFVSDLAHRYPGRGGGLEPGALEMLQAYSWPGNVRELQNLVQKAFLLGKGDALALGDFLPVEEPPAACPDAGTGALLSLSYTEAKESFTRFYLESLLRRHGGNVSRAAREARISRQALHRLLNKHGLDAPAE
jgi:DNA-binding NtrC family response regulator